MRDGACSALQFQGVFTAALLRRRDSSKANRVTALGGFAKMLTLQGLSILVIASEKLTT